ncbi:MAG: PadR family transcriptional regulator [archaeon]
MKIDWSRALMLGLVKLGILSVLNEGPLHGYGIIKKIEEKCKGCCKISVGSLYPALKELENKGLVKSRKKVFNGRKRVVYELTKEGEETLRDGLTKWCDFRRWSKDLFQ